MNLRNCWIFGIALALILASPGLSAADPRSGLFGTPKENTLRTNLPIRCIAFSPYVEGYNPNTGPHPPAALIDALLDVVLYQAGFKCILTYGFLNGLDHIIDAAHNRGMKVIANIWLDTNATVNNDSIIAGIAKAKQYPDTIIRLSCGSELRTRLTAGVAEPIIQGCLTQVRNAGVTQPLTSIDTWWQWCNETWPCQARGLASQVDWIGINVYPWWENKYSGIFPCTAAADAAEFHVARVGTVQAIYPSKTIWLTEFGWPAGPDGYSEINQFTQQACGVANEANQRLVIEESLQLLEQAGIQGVLFEAFRELWKTVEGPVGSYWGICDGTYPYHCRHGYGFTNHLYLPLLLRN